MNSQDCRLEMEAVYSVCRQVLACKGSGMHHLGLHASLYPQNQMS